MYVCMYVCIYIYIYMYVCMYVCVYIYIYIYIYIAAKAASQPGGPPAGRARPSGMSLAERLTEYGWKPHRDCLAQKNISRASTYLVYACKTEGYGLSNSRSQTVLFQQYSVNLSLAQPLSQSHPTNIFNGHYGCLRPAVSVVCFAWRLFA